MTSRIRLVGLRILLAAVALIADHKARHHRCCGAIHPGPPFRCTLNHGHHGEHFAEDTDGVLCAVWAPKVDAT